jgi:hypothetical protein
MRRIKETFILCCTVAMLFTVMPNLCCAQTPTVKVSGKVQVIVPVYMLWKPDVPKLTAADARRLMALETETLSPVEVKPPRGFLPGIQIPKLTKEAAMRAVELQYGKFGLKPYAAVILPPGVDGRAVASVQNTVVGVNVSTDDGQCCVTNSSSNFNYSFNVPCGQRTFTYSKDGFYIDPWQPDISCTMTDSIVHNITMTAATTGIALKGQLIDVTKPSTKHCIEVTLSKEGVCDPVLRSMCASQEDGLQFSFEDLPTEGTYKVAVTDAACAPINFEISRTYYISSTTNPKTNCVFKGLNCQ